EDKMIFTPNYDDEHFFDAFKKPCTRPQGVRYRDDDTLHRIAMQQMQQLHAYPVMVQERPVEQGGGGGGPNGGGESSSMMRSDPSLEDIDLIDVLWREDIEREKSGGAAVATGVGVHPSDQYERDLQLLTEKSVQAPLTREESSRYEDLSKVYFEDFYSNRRFAGEFTDSKSLRRVGGVTSSAATTSSSSSSSSSCTPTSSSTSSTTVSLESPIVSLPSSSTTVPSTVSSTAQSTTETKEQLKRRGFTASDADVDALFEDIGKECGELNMLMPTEGAGMNCPIPVPTTGANCEYHMFVGSSSVVVQQSQQTQVGYTGPMPTADTLLHNVSLATIAPYNPANLTELDFMARDGLLPTGNQQEMLPPIVTSLSVNSTGGFPDPTQFWFESSTDGSASYQSRQPVLNMSTLQLPPLGVSVLGDAAAAAVSVVVQPMQQQSTVVSGGGGTAQDDMNVPPAHHELTTLTGRMPAYETRPSVRTSSISSTNETQSLCASSSSSSSSSPRYSSTSTTGGAGSDGENRSPRSSCRFYGKLAPIARASAASISLFDDEEEDGDANAFFRSPSTGVSLLSQSGGLNSAVAPRRRGRQSKDEQLAASNGLPVSAYEIAEMSLPELQKLLKADSLTEPQRQLIRKIRRRGKNKVAARTCRQRRGATRNEPSSSFENSRVLGYSNRH
ncbi:hypothetical protein PFISCL1PPCAC_15813, partial [Pristionchus fissidentatus]